MATYLLEELPVFLTGMLYQGTKYQILVYPTTAAHSSYGLASLIYEVQTWPQFSGLRQEIHETSSTIATKGIVVLPLAEPNEENFAKIQVAKESIIRQYSSQG